MRNVHSLLSVCISNFCRSFFVTSYFTMCGSRSSKASIRAGFDAGTCPVADVVVVVVVVPSNFVEWGVGV